MTTKIIKRIEALEKIMIKQKPKKKYSDEEIVEIMERYRKFFNEDPVAISVLKKDGDITELYTALLDRMER